MKHKPALYALLRLHAELGGKIKDNRKQAAKLAQDMRHVEAVLKLLEPRFNVSQIAPRRRYKGNPWFKRGAIFRRVLDILREAPGPLSSTEISVLVLRDVGVDRPTPNQIRQMFWAVHASLKNNTGIVTMHRCPGASRWSVGAAASIPSIGATPEPPARRLQ